MSAKEMVSTGLLFLGVVLGPTIFLLSIVGYGVTRTMSWVGELKEQRYLRSLPCRNCRYFTNSEFLQCAVNPQQVLTDEARSCHNSDLKKAAESDHEQSFCLRVLGYKFQLDNLIQIVDCLKAR